MINEIFKEELMKFNTSNVSNIKNAMKEVLQDIILVGLARSEFFKFSSFYGGTSLRIFRGLPRFSEDLDFTFVEDVEDFDFSKYLNEAKNEIESNGIKCNILIKEKNIKTTVESCFFIFNLKYLFDMSFPNYSNQIIKNENLSIKVEAEKNFFSGGKIENKILTFPSIVQVKTFDMETLFASKLIAVLNRKWKTRIKGRDFYDYLYYISRETKVNMEFLKNGLIKFGYISEKEEYTIEKLKKELIERFENVDFEKAKDDVLPFIGVNDKFINSFNKDIFMSTVELIKES